MNLHQRVKVEIKNIETLEMILLEMKSIFYIFINLYLLYVYNNYIIIIMYICL